MANSADPDQLALHCLQRQVTYVFSRTRVKLVVILAGNGSYPRTSTASCVIANLVLSSSSK